MNIARILSQLLQSKDIGKYIVPIIPDEARTFGLNSRLELPKLWLMLGKLAWG